MHMLMYLAEMAPLESLAALLWLSYNYPNSIFRQIVYRFGIWVGFIACIIVFGFIMLNLQHFIPNGIPYDSDDGISSQILYMDPNEGPDQNGIIQNRIYGHTAEIKIINNTNVDVNGLTSQIHIFECETKPQYISGPKEPSDCVYNESHDDIFFGDTVFKSHKSYIFKLKTFANPTNLSSGKYKYMFYKSNIISSTEINEDDNREEFRK